MSLERPRTLRPAFACALVALFLRTRLGIAMTSAGENPTYARAIGIHVPRMRVGSIVISTWNEFS